MNPTGKKGYRHSPYGYNVVQDPPLDAHESAPSSHVQSPGASPAVSREASLQNVLEGQPPPLSHMRPQHRPPPPAFLAGDPATPPPFSGDIPPPFQHPPQEGYYRAQEPPAPFAAPGYDAPKQPYHPGLPPQCSSNSLPQQGGLSRDVSQQSLHDPRMSGLHTPVGSERHPGLPSQGSYHQLHSQGSYGQLPQVGAPLLRNHTCPTGLSLALPMNAGNGSHPPPHQGAQFLQRDLSVGNLDNMSRQRAGQGVPPPAFLQDIPGESDNGAREPRRQESFESHIGNLAPLAKSPAGSSFLQATLRRQPESHVAIFNELRPGLGSLLLDDNACYVAKMLLEMCPHEQLISAVAGLANDEQLWVALATRSLHSRRMVQFILDKIGFAQAGFIVGVAQRNFHTLATSKEGCITLQRILDRCEPAVRENLFDQCRASLVQYSQDSFANFVVQYMFEHSDGDRNLAAMQAQFTGTLGQLCCRQHASAMLEKTVAVMNESAHSFFVNELFGPQVSDDTVAATANDGRGNYVVQALVAKCSPRLVEVIRQRVGPLNDRLQYGLRLAQRINRRLGGASTPQHNAHQ